MKDRLPAYKVILFMTCISMHKIGIMEYRIATKEDIDMLMNIRLEMLQKVNELSDNYVFSDELIANSKRYFLQGNQTTGIAMENGKVVACADIDR